MNAERLKRLQAQVRIGGKGTPRRKKKVTHQTAATDDKKLQSSLKKLSVSTIPGIEEVNIIKDDLTVIHFNNPKAQASLSANTFAVTGHGETKKVVEMLPEILPQLGKETVFQLRMFANSMSSGQNQDTKPTSSSTDDFADDVPLLVEDFDQIAKQEASIEPKVKLNTKHNKNKSKATTEDQPKLDKQSKPDQKPQTGVEKEAKIEEIPNTGAPKKIENDEGKPKAIEQTQVENQAVKLNEKEGKPNKNQDNEKTEKDLNSKEDLQKAEAPILVSNKDQKKENKKDTQPDKNVPKHEVKKDIQAPVKNKSTPTDAHHKEAQQSNKKTQQANTNKNAQQGNSPKEAQQGNSPKEGQQPKKNQNVQHKPMENKQASQEVQQKPAENNQKTVKEIAPEKTVLSSVINKEEKVSEALKDHLKTEKPDQDIEKKNNKDITPLADIKPQSQGTIKQVESSAREEPKTSEVPLSQEIKTPAIEQKAPVKDLALPIPPIIPPQSMVTNKAPVETKPNAEPIPLEYKKEPASTKSEVPNQTNVADVATGDNRTDKPQDNSSAVELERNVAVAAAATKQPEKTKETSNPKPSSELPKTNEANSKITAVEAPILPETITGNQAPAAKPVEKPKPSPQQKAPGASKSPPNQKQASSKEATKQPAPQQQKPAPEAKKTPTSTENKKDNENPKGKPAPTKPQSGNNNAVKSPPTQQQQQQQRQAQKTSTSTPAANKPNEKAATTSKPASSEKTAQVAKKPGSGPPTSPNTKPVDNKTKTSPTANKPKTQPQQGPQKTGKPRLNSGTAAGAPQTKAAEKPATLPTADAQSTAPPQTPTQQ